MWHSIVVIEANRARRTSVTIKTIVSFEYLDTFVSFIICLRLLLSICFNWWRWLISVHIDWRNLSWWFGDWEHFLVYFLILISTNCSYVWTLLERIKLKLVQDWLSSIKSQCWTEIDKSISNYLDWRWLADKFDDSFPPRTFKYTDLNLVLILRDVWLTFGGTFR